MREDDLFSRDPAAFLSREFELLSNNGAGSQHDELDRRRATWQQLIGSAAEGLADTLPSHIVLFDPVGKEVEDLLTKEGFAKVSTSVTVSFVLVIEQDSRVTRARCR